MRYDVEPMPSSPTQVVAPWDAMAASFHETAEQNAVETSYMQLLREEVNCLPFSMELRGKLVLSMPVCPIGFVIIIVNQIDS